MNGYKIVLLKAIFMLYRLPESERVCSGICTYIIRILKYMDIFSVFTAGFFIGGFIIVIIMCSFKD